MVDNIEDVDIVVGFLAETTRPHGFAISETQFHIFIINASRRLYSDRFFTSSFRPEFYSTFGLNWVMNNGPGEPVMEDGTPNGHEQQVLPMKRVLLRTMPELQGRAEKRGQRLRPVGARPRRRIIRSTGNRAPTRRTIRRSSRRRDRGPARALPACTFRGYRSA